jgi:quercetin dioxygenase-like cupin family protein
MLKVDLNNLELNEFIAKENPGQRCLATFPMLGAHGTRASATVFVQLDPDEELGTHTDSAEELLLVLEGTIEAQVGDDKAVAKRGEILHVPKMVPHNFKNVGTEKSKVLGFFGGANNIIATFDHKWWPTESNMVDTATVSEQ